MEDDTSRTELGDGRTSRPLWFCTAWATTPYTPSSLVWVQHYIAALLHNTAFLKGDLLHSIPQNSGMVQRNRHDDRRQGSIDDVGGVKASAQPHFQHNDITFFLINH